MTPCFKYGCGEPGTYQLIIRAWHSSKPEQKAQGRTNLLFCVEHAEPTTGADVLSEEGEAVLKDQFVHAGYRMPDSFDVIFEWVSDDPPPHT